MSVIREIVLVAARFDGHFDLFHPVRTRLDFGTRLRDERVHEQTDVACDLTLYHVLLVELALDDLVPDRPDLELHELLKLCSPRWPNNVALIV